jgi:hypothetical protein
LIRPACFADIPKLLEMGKRFADEAGVTARVGWDEASVVALLGNLIESPAGILLIGEQSMFGGLVYPHPFNAKCVIFQEMFWRSEGREGLRAYYAALEQAKALGATHCAMMATEGSNPERVSALYSRMGFSPFDRTFIKEL